MTARIWFALALCGTILVPTILTSPTPACCPAPPSGKPVVNADQTVLIVWNADTKTEHFIRKASFKSDADDFGFLVPTPSQPQLEESGNEAFPFLSKLTEPEIIKRARPKSGVGCGCGGVKHASKSVPTVKPEVRVVEEKLVAGFHASVLEAKSTEALTNWLKDHNYNFSREVEAWAKPYVEGGWMITALKVAKGKDAKDNTGVTASSLRLSFKTDRPLFPYREPDSQRAADALKTNDRLLRIFFVGESRYQGELTKEVPWTGKAAWANKLSAENRTKMLELLKLPADAAPADSWLTEFEDDWPYRVAPADLYFSSDPNQNTIRRDPIIQYVSSPLPTDAMIYMIALALVLPPMIRKVRRAA